MMLIAFCGDKGSPGVTTAALAIASAWPEDALVLEADPTGGDLGIRLRPNGSALPEAPTVLTVASAARQAADAGTLLRHAHPLNSTTAVIPAPILAEQMATVGDWSPLARVLGQEEGLVAVDVGHLHSTSPVIGLAAQADVVVVVVRPTMTSVVRTRERLSRLAASLSHLRGEPPRLFVLVVSTMRHGGSDAADLRDLLTETPIRPFLVGVGHLANDPSALGRVESGEEPAGRLARTDLLRSARELIGQLVPDRAASSAASLPKAGVRQ